MKTIENGHIYALDMRSGRTGDTLSEHTRLKFVNREPGHEHDGTTTQDAIRALIDRTQYCDHCLPWSGNKQIVQHLRMALVMHECRALMRKVETGELMPELVQTAADGHFVVRMGTASLPSYAFPKEPEPTETGSLEPGEPCHTPVSRGAK